MFANTADVYQQIQFMPFGTHLTWGGRSEGGWNAA